MTPDRIVAISEASRCTTYFVSSKSDPLQTIGPATAGGSVSGAERLLCKLCRLSIEDLALRLELGILSCALELTGAFG